MNWIEASKLKVGDVVVFNQPFDIFPEALIPPETTAVVEENGLNEIYATMIVKPDDEGLRGKLSAWSGNIYLYGPTQGGYPEPWLEPAPIDLWVG